MARIRVPKTPKSAYNPNRTPGTLLQNQLAHLEWATRPAAERAPEKLQIAPATTEAEAAARIEALTLELQRQTSGRPPIVRTAAKRSKRSARKPKATPRRPSRR
jgi:hypothetical protein